MTPSIYKAERLLLIAKDAHPSTVTVLGGIHTTFLYQQARSVSSQGKNNHDAWDCEIFLRTRSALHELPYSPTFLR